MQIPPNFEPQSEQSPSEQTGRFHLLTSSSTPLFLAANCSKVAFALLKLPVFNANIAAPKTAALPENPPLLSEENQKLKEDVQNVLKGLFEEDNNSPLQEESPTNEELDAIEQDPFTSLGLDSMAKGEKELINEVLYRLEKGFLSLQINDYEIFSQEILLNLFNQIPNPQDRIELLSNTLLSSFAHMAITQEGEENVIHILELASPPQKILGDLPHLYEVHWRIYSEGVSIEKESQYALMTPVKGEVAGETIPLYHYAELIDFREGQEKHHIQIEPSTKSFDPINHRLIWDAKDI
ncbi:MAG: hypothetical protein ACOYK9_04775 [Chlamydiia bacterium]